MFFTALFRPLAINTYLGRASSSTGCARARVCVCVTTRVDSKIFVLGDHAYAAEEIIGGEDKAHMIICRIA